MSFKCQKCLKPQPAGTKPILKVSEVRKVEYDGGFDEDGIENPPSNGHEIVRELKLCASCAVTWQF